MLDHKITIHTCNKLRMLNTGNSAALANLKRLLEAVEWDTVLKIVGEEVDEVIRNLEKIRSLRLRREANPQCSKLSEDLTREINLSVHNVEVSIHILDRMSRSTWH